MKIKRTVFLCSIPKTERWLSDMAAQGNILNRIEDNTFTFSTSTPRNLHYFIINPEKGGQNGGWVYYEAVDRGAVKIACTSPFLALQLPYDKNPIWDYYYAHRNYFLIHRFVRNLVFSFIFGLSMAIACCLKMLVGQFDIITACIGILSLSPAGFYIYSLIHFLRSCKEIGQKVSWKRPIRPGYETNR